MAEFTACGVRDTLKNVYDKIGAYWWAILLAAVALCIILFLAIAHKNKRIAKLKREIKRTRTELETERAALETERAESAAQKRMAASATAAADAAAAFAAVAMEDDVRTEEIDAPLADEEDADEVEQAANRVAYYNKASVVSQKEGNIKYIVKYDRAKDSWVIKKEGMDRVVRRLDTKEEAMTVARQLCRKHDANLVVHKKDGRFQKQ